MQWNPAVWFSDTKQYLMEVRTEFRKVTWPTQKEATAGTIGVLVVNGICLPRSSSMAKQWYIIHTYSGHEAKAMRALLDRAKAMGKEEFFDEVLIPEETVVEMVKGEKRTSKRKYFPGYILVHMELTDETWHIVRGTPKITGFVGGDKKPPPISDEEVARMTQQIKDGAAKPKPKIMFDQGENVRVVTGPFANFSGFIDEVMPEKEKLRVMVHVFGRATPVVLDYTNVEKA
jgi:transcriptional antiterminator NusG